MSNVELPPQKSPTDTSNWENKVFTSPKVKSVDKVKKSVARRDMILNAPQRKRKKQPTFKELGIEKTR